MLYGISGHRDRDRRHAHRPHRHDPPRHPLRAVRRRAAAARGHAAAGDGVRPRAAPARPHRAGGASCSSYALAVADIQWTPVRVVAPRRSASCAARSSSARRSCSAPASRSGRSAAREVANAFTYGGNTMTSYPLNIFGPWLRRLLAFVIPLALRDVLPRPLPARQARSARLPDRVPVARARRRARVRDAHRVRLAHLGPPLPEHRSMIRVDARLQDASRCGAAPARPPRARDRRRGRGRVVQRRRGRDGRLRRPERRGQVARRSRC